jgi:hypothetical protein
VGGDRSGGMMMPTMRVHGINITPLTNIVWGS